MQEKKQRRTDEERRSIRLDMRVTPSEKKALVTAAALAGVTVTEFILGCAIGDKFGQMMIDGWNKK